MAVKVLVVDIHAELYRDRLQAEFPDLQFMLFDKAAEVSGDLSDIDVMIMFGIEIRDRMLTMRRGYNGSNRWRRGWITYCAVYRCARMFSLQVAAAFMAYRCASTSST